MAKPQLAWRRRQIESAAAPREQPARSRLSEGAMLALVPVIGSALAFLFESGFLYFYGIPSSFVKLDVPSIVQASILLLCTGAMLVLLGGLAAEWSVQRESTLKRVIGTSLPYVLFMLVALLALRPTALQQWLPLLVGMVVLAVLGVYGEAWFKGDAALPFHRRVDAVLAQERMRDEENSRKQPVTRFHKILLIVMTVGALCSFVFQSGIATAKARKTYLALKVDSTLLFVEQYGELSLFKRFDPKTCQLLPEIQVHKVAEGAPLILVQVPLAREVEGRDLTPPDRATSAANGPSAPASSSSPRPGAIAASTTNGSTPSVGEPSPIAPCSPALAPALATSPP
jgi:hypothetical protein